MRIFGEILRDFGEIGLFSEEKNFHPTNKENALHARSVSVLWPQRSVVIDRKGVLSAFRPKLMNSNMAQMFRHFGLFRQKDTLCPKGVLLAERIIFGQN